MRFQVERDNFGKWVLIGATTLMWLLILVLLETRGYHETWALWKVPSWNQPFLDFRLIPGSAESFARGYEPSVQNPYDPTERIFNYPAFWRLFFYTGITQADTIWISVIMILLFFTGVFLFPGRLSLPAVVGMLFVIFSPASMLLYERGNVDLMVFFLCALIVLTASRSSNLAAALIAFAAIVKLFPFFGITVLWKESKNRFWVLFFSCLAVLVVYMVATWSSVRAAWNTTMRGDGLSYGTNVFVTRYTQAISSVFEQWLTPHRADVLIEYGPLVAGLVFLLAVAILALMSAQQPETFSERNFAAFRMGASVYVGTFLLGNNFDYRLAFLILAVPQLVEWMRAPHKSYRSLAWLSMSLILFTCWHLWIVEIPLMSVLGSVHNSKKFWIILDEISNWMLFGSLAYLLLASSPQWLKEQIKSILPKRALTVSTAQ